jgi:hypothetical protein
MRATATLAKPLTGLPNMRFEAGSLFGHAGTAPDISTAPETSMIDDAYDSSREEVIHRYSYQTITFIIYTLSHACGWGQAVS